MLMLDSFVIGVKAPDVVISEKDFSMISYVSKASFTESHVMKISYDKVKMSLSKGDISYKIVGSDSDIKVFKECVDVFVSVGSDSFTFTGKVKKWGVYHVDLQPVIPKYDITVSKFAWWNSSFNNSVIVTINSAYVPDGLNNFPLLVYVNTTVMNRADSGNSIRFVDDDNTTMFYYEIENISTTGNSQIWVKIPHINESGFASTRFIMYYNNSLASYSNTYNDGRKVFNNSYLAVFHSNSTGNLRQSVNNTWGVNVGTSQSYTIIDGTRTYVDGDKDYVTYDMFTMPSVLTIDFWYKKDDTSGSESPFAVRNAASTHYTGLRFVDAKASFRWLNFDVGGKVDEVYDSTNNVVDTSIVQHYAVTRNGDANPLMYSDGSPVAVTHTSGNSDLPTVGGYASIGRWGNYDGLYFDGKIDEVRISTVVRNSSWIKFQWHNYRNYTSVVLMGGILTYNVTIVNFPPHITMFYPSNSSNFSCPCCITLGVTVLDNDSSLMNITFNTNLSGIWQSIEYMTNVLNGTYYISIVDFIYYNYTFYWNVSVDDGNTYNHSNWFILKTDTFNNCNSSLGGSSFFTSGMGTLSFDESQFYLLLIFSLWLFLLLGSEKKPILALLQLLVGIPLGSLCLTIAYFGTITYGYLIGIVIICVSGLVAFLELKR